ncbi:MULTISPECIES: hypothetical protein [Pseudoalteromonas]|uniref:Uncharacterized protein n=1 Tax=Pseudoalteromonas rhizosphaerae TaxID=2518973 RepID=A0ABW8L253_9GAMM|nr:MULTISPECIES: hypothetical protein [Pseudoalteromonas]MBB1335874.1 hypothetical protein [Pseudoalteromonas sp. SR41-6]MBB1344280.1 hypothetical protein [Pseudoalteromonas sp. SR45-6]MBB1419800.1 hypothetical protein [Pseudoalteromonas sp. SG44-1]MBB1436051.1 hypothetical protein [Pseudoalteromonas sp. SG43-6]MBB1461414.1 hypothetical protein [Pseudoalteromonas sp. SG41-8]
MNQQLVFKNGQVSDNYASILLGHQDESYVTPIMEYKEYELIVESVVIILLDDDTELMGTEVLTLVDSGHCTLAQLINFLAGEEVEEMQEFEFISSAWFAWQSKHGDWSSEPFDTVYESQDKNITTLNELLNE